MRRSVDGKRRPDLAFEHKLLGDGCFRIAGLDEAGRGAWAGPVVAAAVVLPLDRPDLAKVLIGVRDSKQMTPIQRESWASTIRQVALGVGLGVASSHEVDQDGLIAATREAMARALTDLNEKPEHLMIDHLPLPQIPLPQTVLTRGDARVLSIAAASVIAKVARDHMMVDLDEHHPGYGFARHKGYGTAQHRAALTHLGPCPSHRFSYAPVAACVPSTE
ncbi:MAG TPA: ribonuclease HII [Anaerolineae bacterium]|nr:ribonuclease HII [Anaerolineae bacterium]